MNNIFEGEVQLFEDLQEAIEEHPIDCENCLEGVVKAIVFGVLACSNENLNHKNIRLNHLSAHLYGKQQQ